MTMDEDRENRDGDDQEEGDDAGFGLRPVVVGIGGQGGAIIDSLVHPHRGLARFLMVGAEKAHNRGAAVPRVLASCDPGPRPGPVAGTVLTPEHFRGHIAAYIAAELGDALPDDVFASTARLALEGGCLTFGMIALPKSAGGLTEEQLARLDRLVETVDALVVAPACPDARDPEPVTSVGIVRQAIFALLDTISYNGASLCWDFSDVMAVARRSRFAMLGVGAREGPDTVGAARRAVRHIRQAGARLRAGTGVLVLWREAEDATLMQVSEGTAYIEAEINDDANTIYINHEPEKGATHTVVTLFAFGYDDIGFLCGG